MKNSYNNPFISCTARDMSYSDVEKFWCPPYECYRIDENTLNRSITPIIIEGARGSGKTMILKHQSFFCKKENYLSGSFLDHISAEGYIGIYFRYSADYGTIFDSLSCSSQYKEQLFNNYFQFCVSIELGKVLSALENEFSINEKHDFFTKLTELCEERIDCSASFISWAELRIRKQDLFIRNAQYCRMEENDIPAASTIVFSIVDILHETISRLKDVLFIFTIDEFENVGIYQKVINTYIKQLDGAKKYTFRIGVRPEGIVDLYTNIGKEFLQTGRDFLLERLEIASDDRSARYRKFVENVINRRLNTVSIFSQGSLTIDKLLGRDEDYSWEAEYHTKGKPLRINDFLGSKITLNPEIKDVILSSEPLVGAYFLMRLKRGTDASKIIQTIKDLSEGRKTELTKKYNLDMQGKYKAALLFWIVDKYKAKKLYYSLSTYLYLSCGSIYDFIGLCRTLFDELESDYFDHIECDPLIPAETQNTAARKYANSQLEKVRINHDYGIQMWHFAKNMCSLFSYYHKGDLCTSYPETNQFYVKGGFANSGLNKEIWKSLIKWGVVIKKSSYQRASVSENSKAQLYYINKLYYPIFNISCRIRGGYNSALTEEIWNSIIISSVDPATLIPSKRKQRSVESDKADTPYEQLTISDWKE